MAHTPGPWVAAPNDSDRYIRVAGWTVPNQPIARVLSRGDHEERGANARLIASAPELLEALKTLLEDIRRHAHGMGAPGHVDHIRAAHAAVAKAEA